MHEDRQIPEYDRKMGALAGRPDVTSTRASTIRVVEPLVGGSSYIVQTFRETVDGKSGDFIFVEIGSREEHRRIVLPPKVAAAIARQAAQLTSRNRSKASKATAAARKERGDVPFIRKAAG